MPDPTPYEPSQIGQLPDSGDPKVQNNYFWRIVKALLPTSAEKASIGSIPTPTDVEAAIVALLAVQSSVGLAWDYDDDAHTLTLTLDYDNAALDTEVLAVFVSYLNSNPVLDGTGAHSYGGGRNTGADDGLAFTLFAGAAKAGANNAHGGYLELKPGYGTGNADNSAGGGVRLWASAPGASGVTDQTVAIRAMLAYFGMRIGDNNLPDPAAVLDVYCDNPGTNPRGFLPPRLTTTQRNTITSPPDGLVIYNSTTHNLEVFRNTAWRGCGGGTARLFSDLASVGNITTTETDINSHSIAANTLAAAGDCLITKASGIVVASGTASRQFRRYFDGNLIFDSGALTFSLSASYATETIITRVDATTVRYSVTMTTEGAALAAYTAAGELAVGDGIDLTTSAILKSTFQAGGVGPASNDMVELMSKTSVEYAN